MIAVMPTFREAMKAIAINFGWLVKPIAAIAVVPKALTMIVSTSDANPTKIDSTVAGQARSIVSFNKCLPSWGSKPEGRNG